MEEEKGKSFRHGLYGTGLINALGEIVVRKGKIRGVSTAAKDGLWAFDSGLLSSGKEGEEILAFGFSLREAAHWIGLAGSGFTHYLYETDVSKWRVKKAEDVRTTRPTRLTESL